MARVKTYFRRCHVCERVTGRSAHEHIERCEHCQKPFAKFSYFDDRYSPVATDNHLRPVFADGEFEPVRGLTVHWSGS
jgi:ribosomal protein L37AE/L43A